MLSYALYIESTRMWPAAAVILSNKVSYQARKLKFVVIMFWYETKVVPRKNDLSSFEDEGSFCFFIATDEK